MTILQILLLTLWAGFSQVDQMTFNLLPSGIIPTAIFTGLVVGKPELGLLVGGTLQSPFSNPGFCVNSMGGNADLGCGDVRRGRRNCRLLPGGKDRESQYRR